MMLDRIQAMVTELTSSNSTTVKIATLRKFGDLREFIQLIWDPQQTTGVTRKKVDLCKIPPKHREYPTDILELLRGLYTRRFSGNEAQYAIVSMLLTYPDHGDLILRIIDKNLKARITHKNVNRAFPGLIPDFSVSLGKDKSKAEAYFRQDPGSWYISRKFDGVRCIVRVDGANTACFSRAGNALPAMRDLAQLAGSVFPAGTVLDGEVCEVDENNHESFQGAVSKIKRKHDVFHNFRFYVFDYLTVAEFDAHTSTRTFFERYEDLGTVSYQDQRIQVVPQTLYTDEMFATMNDAVAAQGWEGLILRRDISYKGTRSNDILKHKKFFTEDYVVTGVESSTMRIINEKTGLEVEEFMTKSVTILHKGEVVHVGSGFDQNQRRHFYNTPESIIGKTIEVQYFEECHDHNGKVSLRFPTMKQIYSKKRKL